MMFGVGDRLRAQAQQAGRRSFRDFMETALYDAEFGYYATHADRIGRAGDYYTSVSVSAHFGRLLARQAVRCWETLGRPTPFLIVECGPGTGHLALDLLSELETAHPDAFAAVRFVLCERSPALRAVQRERLARFGARVAWSDIETLAASPTTGLIFSNELIDALPVHRVKVEDGALRECFVTEREGSLHLVWDTPSRPAEFAAYAEKSRLELREGHEYEIGLDAIAWLQDAARALERGFILTIDYGNLSDHLSERPNGTLRCFSRHVVHEDFLARIGEQDITADVNFSALIAYGADCGLRTLKLERQGDFLIGLGLLDMLQSVTNFEGDTPDALKARLALKHFLVPGGFGDHFKVLLQEKMHE
jgi:SAM-dependent MidA family methyltransferase